MRISALSVWGDRRAQLLWDRGSSPRGGHARAEEAAGVGSGRAGQHRGGWRVERLGFASSPEP